MSLPLSIAPWSPYLEPFFPRSNGRVLLGELLTNYTLLSEGIGPAQIAAAFIENDAWTCDFVVGATRLLGRQLLEGRFTSFARPIGGGPVVSLDADRWELDEFTWRFATCALDLRHPFDALAEPTHRIFVAEEDVDTIYAACVPDYAKPARRTSPIQRDDTVAAVETLALEPLLRLPEVERLVGIKSSTIYSRIKTGTFPPPEKNGSRISVWRESEIREWLANPR